MKTTTYFFMFFIMVLASLASSFIPSNHSTNNAVISTIVPTRTPFRYFLLFNTAKLNKIPPQDILQQISFLGGGGGVICIAGTSPSKPEIVAKPKDGVLMTQSTMIACGWAKGEVLKGTIIYPNGFVLTKSVSVLPNEGLYYGSLNFAPGLSDPVGNYTFILEGKLGIAKDTVNFQKPVGPHLFVVDSKTIMFYGFSSQEKVRFFYYDPGTNKLAGWQEYIMDGAGQLILKSATPFNGYFWAVGKAGEAQLPKEHLLYGGTIYPAIQETIKKLSCGDLPSRMSILQSGHIAFTKVGGNTRLHSEPGLSKPVTAKVPEGTDFRIVGGPKCADGITWWKVSINNPDVIGWVAESDKTVYLIEP